MEIVHQIILKLIHSGAHLKMTDKIIEHVNMSSVIGPCKHCNTDYGYVVAAGQHKKLICCSCDQYIKMLKTSEFKELNIINLNDNTSEQDYSLEHLHFKIDLILSHLNILNSY